MGIRKTVHVPARLEGTRRRFDCWRRTRPGRSRIPEALWAAAVKAAGAYGVHKTAQALRVGYYALKKRVAAAGSLNGTALRRASAGKAMSVDGPAVALDSTRTLSRPRAAKPRDTSRVATFVELAPSVSVCSRECILELEDPSGAKMRVHVKGVEAPDLTALCRSFWGSACASHVDRDEG